MNDLRLNGSDTLAELEAALQRLVAGDFSVRVDVEAGSLGPLSPVVNRLNLLAQTLHFQSQGQAEAMQKAIEEISTQDEELRSSIEELERRNELVESRNQQLLATTRALQANNIEIRALKDDLSNILSSVRIPIVLVSPTGVIRRFNSAASSVFHLTPIDIGRNIGELRLGVEIKRLNDSISDIFANLAPQEFEVQDRQGKWHNLQLRPYITCENVIDGVVMVLIDIDAAKRLGEREVTKVRNELQTLKMDHEELIDSLLFSRLFFENSPSGLNLCQADGQWIASNPALLNMLGYTSEDAIGLTYSKLMPSNHAPAKENPLLRLAIDDRYGPYETEFMRKDGSLIPVRLNGFMVEKDGQKYFWSMVEDLTEIRRLENEAIDQDAILATVIENTPAMIAYWNKDLECVFSNHEYLKWFGLSPGQMKGMPLVKVLGPDLFKTHLPYIQAVLGGENQCFERALVKPDGEVAHAWIQYVAHYRDGAVQGYFVLGTDVTELKKIQETLRVSEVFASSILNSMSEEIVVLDRNGAIVAVNESWLKSAIENDVDPSKLDPKAYMGTDYLRVFERTREKRSDGACDQSVRAGIQAVIDGLLPKFNTEYPYHSLTAKQWFRMSVTPLNAHRSGVVVSHANVTAMHNLQHEVAMERQKAFLNAKLASLGELSAGIAHEINNPLAIISGSIQLLCKHLTNIDEKSKSKLKDIEKSAIRISKIINGLRKFSRSSDDSSKHENVLIKDILSEVQTLTYGKSRQLSTMVDFECQTLGAIFCSDIEIEQVLVNLINNGIDAVQGLGGKWVRVSAFESDGFIVVRVRDSGKGIPVEVREKIFQPFFTTKPVGQGTGLGLSISKGILDHHKGTIEILAADPHTCFELRFPMAEGIENAA